MLTLSRILLYVSYYALFATGQAFSMWGQYVTLPYKHLTYYQGLSMALPFAWINWVFLTFSIDLGHRYELASPTQDSFLLIIVQFCYLLLINRFYLKKRINNSDIYAFFIILIGYAISIFQVATTVFRTLSESH